MSLWRSILNTSASLKFLFCFVYSCNKLKQPRPQKFFPNIFRKKFEVKPCLGNINKIKMVLRLSTHRTSFHWVWEKMKQILFWFAEIAPFTSLSPFPDFSSLSTQPAFIPSDLISDIIGSIKSADMSSKFNRQREKRK